MFFFYQPHKYFFVWIIYYRINFILEIIYFRINVILEIQKWILHVF